MSQKSDSLSDDVTTAGAAPAVPPRVVSLFKAHPFVGADRNFNFGRPRLIGSCLDVSCIANRFSAGEGIAALAQDYGISTDEIQTAIRFELDVARRRISWKSLYAK